MSQNVAVNHLGMVPYEITWEKMKSFVESRDQNTRDEIWLLQHPPVFTLGMAGKEEHILRSSDIPVIHCDRGGQVTYHGPGQLVAYLLIDIARRKIGVRKLVEMIEQAIINLLNEYEIHSIGDRKAPGVYVDGKKIAALGLRVRRHSSYHGLSLNVDMDLSPFNQINPCGYPGLEVTQMRDLGVKDPIEKIQSRLQYHLFDVLGYTTTPT
ncbi:MAG: lipoyl(octanoyl) transferase LipB [Gammaproteobacteria bacterium]|nr:MAG: lipoyl(octanoyl) transferase LipB [Gammaproteobacteria bacterium]